MRRKEIVKRGLAFSLAVALTATGLPLGKVLTVSAAEQQALKVFDFNDGISGWYYGSGWEYDYSAGSSSAVSADDGQLKFDVDYSGDSCVGAL